MLLQVLCSIRGVKVADKAINEEFADIQRAVDGSHKSESSVSSGLVSLIRAYPQILFAAVVIPIAQQFTGMNAIMFVSSLMPCFAWLLTLGLDDYDSQQRPHCLRAPETYPSWVHLKGAPKQKH